jgi:hypothetical protein
MIEDLQWLRHVPIYRARNATLSVAVYASPSLLCPLGDNNRSRRALNWRIDLGRLLPAYVLERRVRLRAAIPRECYPPKVSPDHSLQGTIGWVAVTRRCGCVIYSTHFQLLHRNPMLREFCGELSDWRFPMVILLCQGLSLSSCAGEVSSRHHL